MSEGIAASSKSECLYHTGNGLAIFVNTPTAPEAQTKQDEKEFGQQRAIERAWQVKEATEACQTNQQTSYGWSTMSIKIRPGHSSGGRWTRPYPHPFYESSLLLLFLHPCASRDRSPCTYRATTVISRRGCEGTDRRPQKTDTGAATDWPKLSSQFRI